MCIYVYLKKQFFIWVHAYQLLLILIFLAIIAIESTLIYYTPEISQFAPQNMQSRKGHSSSNHHFPRGELLNFGSVPVGFSGHVLVNEVLIPPKTKGQTLAPQLPCLTEKMVSGSSRTKLPTFPMLT